MMIFNNNQYNYQHYLDKYAIKFPTHETETTTHVYGNDGNNPFWTRLIDIQLPASRDAFTIHGEGGDDYVHSGMLHDTFGTRSVTFFGGDGDDRMMASEAFDTFFGGHGEDTMSYYRSNSGVFIDLLDGKAGLKGFDRLDNLYSVENIEGSKHSDWIKGDAENNKLKGNLGNDSLYGDAGNDIIVGGRGADIIDGGAGIDTTKYTVSPHGVTVLLSTGQGIGGDAQGDVLRDIENVEGSIRNDVLVGNNANNILRGHGGIDRLEGGNGNDVLEGGRGDDILVGGEGRDVFEFRCVRMVNLRPDRDVIVDFEDGVDRLSFRYCDPASNDISQLTITSRGNDAIITVNELDVEDCEIVVSGAAGLIDENDLIF